MLVILYLQGPEHCLAHTNSANKRMSNRYLVFWQEQFLGLWWALGGSAEVEIMLGGPPLRMRFQRLSSHQNSKGIVTPGLKWPMVVWYFVLPSLWDSRIWHWQALCGSLMPHVTSAVLASSDWGTGPDCTCTNPRYSGQFQMLSHASSHLRFTAALGPGSD